MGTYLRHLSGRLSFFRLRGESGLDDRTHSNRGILRFIETLFELIVRHYLDDWLIIHPTNVI